MPKSFHLFLILVNTTGVAALFYGIRMLEPSPIGASLPGAVSGMMSQALVTGLPLLLVLAAAAANIVMGASVARMALGRPFDSISSFVLTGLAGAVLIDSAALMVLGSLHFFVWPVILIMHGSIYGVTYRGFRPLLTLQPPSQPRLPVLALLLPALVWGVPVVLQLASPVVPFMDVLPNHVSPVEHVRTFASFETLITSPSPDYGPSRTLFGYVALQATIATLVNLPAALSIAAFTLPLVLLSAMGTYRVAGSLFGAGAAYWSLITFPLTFVFLRIPDVRANALVFPLVAWTLVSLVTPPARQRWAQQTLVGMGLGASLYIHPLIAALLALTIAALALLWPIRFARIGVPALAGGALLALPQAAATLGVSAPSWSGLLALPLAYGCMRIFDRWNVGAIRLVRPALALAGLLALPVVADVVGYTAEALRDIAAPFPLLASAALLGLLTLHRHTVGWRVIGTGLAVALFAGVGSRLLPADSSLVQSLQGEVYSKALAYWAPFLLALAAAAACHHVATLRRWSTIGQTFVLAFVVFAILPIRLSPSTVAIDNLEEHRMAESASIALRHAQNGYWMYYPDSRTLVNASQRELLNKLEAERRLGLIGPRTHLLHAAESFRAWVRTPVAVFTGIYESTVSYDPERSIHTNGGRLYDMAEFEALVHGNYSYVLIEGADLVGRLRARVERAGYKLIFENDRGQLYRRLVIGCARSCSGAVMA